jgi:[ribosomal protein S5]-alanine N-acetyltransferase
MDYFLTSERMGLRNWTADDLPLALELWTDAQVTGLIGGPFTPAEVRARLVLEMEQLKESGVQYWPVFVLADGRHAGCAGLRPYRAEQKIYELGIHLRPGFWGQGYAAELARMLIEYAFGRLDVRALWAGHHPENAGSRRLLAKLNFVYRGDQLYIPTGLMHPTYSLQNARQKES